MKIDNSIPKAFSNDEEVNGIYHNGDLVWEKPNLGDEYGVATLVNNINELNSGDKILLVYNNGSGVYVAGAFTGRVFEFMAATLSVNESLEVSDDMTIFTLENYEEGTSKLLFDHEGPKYLKPYSASANGFTSTEDQTGENTDWTISIGATSSEATITAIEPRSIVSNPNASNFTCANPSSTTYYLPQIYKINK